MMGDDQWVLLDDYLRLNKNFNGRNFEIIRERYEQQCGGSFPDPYDESALRQVAHDLKIKVNTGECLELLSDCVMNSVEYSRTLTEESWKTRTIGQTTDESYTSLLTDIDCVIKIKVAFSKVSTFIRSILLQSLSVSTPVTTNINKKSFVLDVHCPLYLFIREQLHERYPTTSKADHNVTRFRLVEPINTIDEFGPWFYDYWQGVFDIEMVPHDDQVQFPARWSLTDDVKIHCRIENCTSKGKSSLLSHVDTLRTATLDVFVHDICQQENNNQSEQWLQKLRQEDIFTFEHLTSLTQSEWDRMAKVPVNTRRILKAAVDRTRTNIAGGRVRRVIEQFDGQNNEETESSSTNSSMSESELSANLHVIKLFLRYKLRDHPLVHSYGFLARLESKCLDLAFEEMKSEGFADDGLFPKIREFFVPLTVSEQELKLERTSNQGVRLTLCEELREQNRLTVAKRAKWIDDEKKCTDEIAQIEQKIKDHEGRHVQLVATWQPKKNNKKQQKQLEALHRIYQDSLRRQEQLLKERSQLTRKKEKISKKIQECNDHIEKIKERLLTIEMELNTPHKPIEQRLVKPPRGLIMYGPPGTGKSEILSKLANKLGIIMVGPPLAAGELNRSLVGESERVIVALCSRCHQIPYVMCCVSIDEIDSLAPKRDEDSSEGKVDKISVLLSLIDGIKDVPNLMILSATNRLHMMDEAFLRRMSGKYFVGRPSSDARLSILKTIPCWALEPELLNRLTLATTNFSGAAVKALTRELTVKCIEKQRTDRTYQIGKIEALKIADRIARQYQIFIGSETLPRLSLRNNLDDSRTNHLSVNDKYTGRMIVDLHNKHIRIEVSMNQNQSSIIEHDLYPNETNVQTLLERLANYGKTRNVQFLQLIDLNLLASQGAYDEKKVYETLKDRYDECVSYSRSMIVYDLDALVGVNKSESNSSTGPSTSSSIHNQSIYTYVLARFRDRVIEDIQQNGEENIERWAIVVIRDPFLLRQFCRDAQYARTPQEEKQEESERRKAEDVLKCVKCRDFYIENENKMGLCTHHDGFVFDTEAADLEIYTPSEVAAELRKLEHDTIKYPARREQLELQRKKFKWICCDEPFTSVRTGGCKRGKHGFFPKGSQDSITEPHINGGTDRLTQAMIDEWEDACRHNVEYNEKWIILAKEF